MNYKVSIIFPVYNVGEYLEESLNSLYNQTYQNFEIIAVNDGSTDKSLEILKKYLSRGKLKIINQENKGLSEARNTGIDCIEGEIVYFMDSDDWILPDTLEKTVRIFETTDVDMVRFNANPFSDNPEFKINLNEYDYKNVLKENVIYNKEELFGELLNFYIAPVWLYMIKSSILLESGLKFKKNLLHEDELFTPLITSRCQKISYLNEKFFQRRYREGSIMTTQKSLLSIENYLIIMNDLDQYCKTNIDSKSNEAIFYSQVIRDLFYVSCSLDFTQYAKKNLIKDKFGVKLSVKQVIKLKIKKIRGIVNEE